MTKFQVRRNLLNEFNATEHKVDTDSSTREKKFEIPDEWLNPEFPIEIPSSCPSMGLPLAQPVLTSAPNSEPETIQEPLVIGLDNVITSPGWEGWPLSSFLSVLQVPSTVPLQGSTLEEMATLD